MSELNDRAIRVLTDFDAPETEEEGRALLAALFRSGEELTPEFLEAFRLAIERGLSGDESGPQIVMVDTRPKRPKRTLAKGSQTR